MGHRRRNAGPIPNGEPSPPPRGPADSAARVIDRCVPAPRRYSKPPQTSTALALKMQLSSCQLPRRSLIATSRPPAECRFARGRTRSGWVNTSTFGPKSKPRCRVSSRGLPAARSGRGSRVARRPDVRSWTVRGRSARRPARRGRPDSTETAKPRATRPTRRAPRSLGFPRERTWSVLLGPSQPPRSLL